MRMILSLLAAVLALKLEVVAHAANPSYTDFYSNQFNTANYKVALRPFQTSITIPMGAWFTNNVADGASLSAASALSITNTGDGFAFADTVTNVINTRFALPWDYDLGVVQMSLMTVCTQTNHASATNAVFAVRATAMGDQKDVTNPTWGTLVLMSNQVAEAAYIQKASVSDVITIGGGPLAGRSVLWQIQRLGSHSSDVETNSGLSIVEVRVFYNFAVKTNAPNPFP